MYHKQEEQIQQMLRENPMSRIEEEMFNNNTNTKLIPIEDIKIKLKWWKRIFRRDKE